MVGFDDISGLQIAVYHPGFEWWRYIELSSRYVLRIAEQMVLIKFDFGEGGTEQRLGMPRLILSYHRSGAAHRGRSLSIDCFILCKALPAKAEVHTSELHNYSVVSLHALCAAVPKQAVSQPKANITGSRMLDSERTVMSGI